MKPFKKFGIKDERIEGVEAITRTRHEKKDFYRFTLNYQFDETVPEEIKGIWSFSLDLFNHSFLNYEFVEPSNLYALMTAEAALKEILKDEIVNPEKETMGSLFPRFIKKFKKSHHLTKEHTDWFDTMLWNRNHRAHLNKKFYGPPFGFTLIPTTFDFVQGLFRKPMAIITPVFTNQMNAFINALSLHPYVFYKAISNEWVRWASRANRRRYRSPIEIVKNIESEDAG